MVLPVEWESVPHTLTISALGWAWITSLMNQCMFGQMDLPYHGHTGILAMDPEPTLQRTVSREEVLMAGGGTDNVEIFCIFIVNQVIRKWKHFVRTGNVLTILLGNNLNLDLWPWPCNKISYWRQGVLVPHQGQSQRSTLRSLPSKIVKTFPFRTKCFHFLTINWTFWWKRDDNMIDSMFLQSHVCESMIGSCQMGTAPHVSLNPQHRRAYCESLLRGSQHVMTVMLTTWWPSILH